MASTLTTVPQALHAISPRFAGGVERIYAVLDADGALSAARKALFVAAAAAVADQPTMLEQWMARTHARGMAAADVAGVAILLMLNRGERAHRDFAAVAERVYGTLPAVVTAADDGANATPEDGLAYLAAHFRADVPPRSRLFARVAPGAFTGYYLMHSTAINHNAFEPKLAELTLCAVMAAAYEFSFLPVHAGGARNHGATDDELAEAMLCAVPISGVTAWAGGAGAIIATAP
jgi:alkylhydroperoxidase/carboxymuconolactone decarboxylase family protein YurZ